MSLRNMFKTRIVVDHVHVTCSVEVHVCNSATCTYISCKKNLVQYTVPCVTLGCTSILRGVKRVRLPFRMHYVTRLNNNNKINK